VSYCIVCAYFFASYLLFCRKDVRRYRDEVGVRPITRRRCRWRCRWRCVHSSIERIDTIRVTGRNICRPRSPMRPADVCRTCPQADKDATTGPGAGRFSPSIAAWPGYRIGIVGKCLGTTTTSMTAKYFERTSANQSQNA